MATQNLILLGVGLYMAVMIAIGFYASRGTQSLTDFVVAGRKMPLCCENIFAPVITRPAKPEGVDKLARRVREFLETVVAGVTQAKD